MQKYEAFKKKIETCKKNTKGICFWVFEGQISGKKWSLNKKEVLRSCKINSAQYFVLIT